MSTFPRLIVEKKPNIQTNVFAISGYCVCLCPNGRRSTLPLVLVSVSVFIRFHILSALAQLSNTKQKNTNSTRLSRTTQFRRRNPFNRPIFGSLLQARLWRFSPSVFVSIVRSIDLCVDGKGVNDNEPSTHQLLLSSYDALTHSLAHRTHTAGDTFRHDDCVDV